METKTAATSSKRGSKKSGNSSIAAATIESPPLPVESSEPGSKGVAKRGRKKKASAAEAVTAAPVEVEPVAPDSKPKRAPRKRKAKDVLEAEPEVLVKIGEMSGEESDLTPLEGNDDDFGGSPTKKRKTAKATSPRKPRAAKPPPVYVIPEVQVLPTTFKGRLGYACLNTILRNIKPTKDAVFCSRTCRIATLVEHGQQHAKDLGRQNAVDLLKLLEWNEANRIKFMRISSEMFPFASHDKWGYGLEYAKAELEKVGEYAKEHGHRLTTHPGQFTQLGSPTAKVVTNSIRELEYHAELLDLIGLGPDSVMIIHGGGIYGDKPAALARIKENIKTRLPAHVRARLVLENDEICYSAEDLLPLCEELDIPLVFDYHHDWILPSSIPRKEIIARANAIFARRGIRPKQHLSSPRPGAVTAMEKRAHANRCETLPEDLPDDMDLMIEAKDKEQAVLHLYRIYQLETVINDSLRPPAENETLATGGRKVHKPKSGASPRKARAVKKGTDESEVEAEETEVDYDALEASVPETETAEESEDAARVPVSPKRTPTKRARSWVTRA